MPQAGAVILGIVLIIVAIDMIKKNTTLQRVLCNQSQVVVPIAPTLPAGGTPTVVEFANPTSDILTVQVGTNAVAVLPGMKTDLTLPAYYDQFGRKYVVVNYKVTNGAFQQHVMYLSN